MIRLGKIKILDTLAELVNPKHTALLLWDFDRRVLSNAFNYESVVENTSHLLAAARTSRVPVLYAIQNNMRIVGDTGAPTIRMRLMRQSKGVAALATMPEPSGDPPTPEIVEKVKPLEGEIIFEKFVPNAFMGTSFEWWLKSYGVKTIILTGINVATGINGTAREAISRGFYSVVAADCVATPREDDYHAAIQYIDKIFDLYSSGDIIAAWSATARR
jgi:nicotinamidase-related amidase